jgi:hypothetical protein
MSTLKGRRIPKRRDGKRTRQKTVPLSAGLDGYGGFLNA